MVQELLFEQGYRWAGTGQDISELDQEYLYASESGIITFTRNPDDWFEDPRPELKLD